MCPRLSEAPPRRRIAGSGVALWLVLATVLLPRPGAAGQAVPQAPRDLPFVFDGPPPPIPPSTVTRDADGRATVRAVRLGEALRVDGRLDEPLYTTVEPVSDFVQIEPREGMPATERTDVWVSFTGEAVFVSVRCWETRPDRIVGNEMRRDSMAIFQGNDHIAFIFDTFYDRRNGVLFEANAVGGRIDAQVTNERQFSMDWNPIWEVKVGRFEDGWTVEAAIPFKSLRYRPGRGQIWGFNVRRGNQWKNESSFLTRMPNALGPMAIFQTSLAATLVGLEAPPASRNLDIKPYVVSDLETDATATPRVSNDIGGDVGVDVKYGVTESLTADLTYNTDFAQVEADEQQVNLTRFSLFFPEKREFFLENQGLFSFGGAAAGGASAGGAGAGDTPVLFYSRRIGLNRGRAVPIQGGGRLTGRVGRFSVGLLDIRTGEEEVTRSRPTNFSVVRLKRDILRRSSVGLIATGRSVAQSGLGRNEAYGADGAFAFYDNLAINAYWARTQTDGLKGQDSSYRAHLNYAADRYGLQLERIVVGKHFNPEVGFLRRGDMRRNFGEFRFSPRPRNSRVVRRYSWTTSVDYIENGAGLVEMREYDSGFGVELQSSDRFNVGVRRTFEALPAPFPIAPGVTLPAAGYTYTMVRAGANFGQLRRLAANVSVESGRFYSGHRTSLSVSRGRVSVSSSLSVEPVYSIDRVNLVQGRFTTHLAGSRITYTATPLAFVSALVQYHSGAGAIAANVRWRWEYRPGSELFVVYNEGRDTRARRFPDLASRALIVKVNRLFRF